MPELWLGACTMAERWKTIGIRADTHRELHKFRAKLIAETGRNISLDETIRILLAQAKKAETRA